MHNNHSVIIAPHSKETEMMVLGSLLAKANTIYQN